MRPLAVALVLSLLAPPAARAWNSIGHMAVAKLAYDHLETRDKLRLFRILQQHPHYDEFLAKHRPKDVELAEWVFLRASTWPDWIRPRGRAGQVDPRGDRVVKYHRPTDHYVNLPFVLPADAEHFADKNLAPDGDAMTVEYAYRQRFNEVALANTTAEDKAVAICWLLHLIGDVHQPLHAISQYSSLFPDKGGDLGGNLFGVKVGGRATNLHRYWDDLLGDDNDFLDDGSDRQVRIFRKAVDTALALARDEAKFGREALKADLERRPDFGGWVVESFEIAKTVAYKNGALKAVRVRDGQVPPDAEEVGKDYQEAATATAQRRAALAGFRMADKLKVLAAKLR